MENDKIYDIVIVGAGTAGLSAAIYGVRAGKSVILLEESAYGGQIIKSLEVENYPAIKHISGYDFATNLYEQAIELGAEIKYLKVTGIKNNKDTKVVVTNESNFTCKSVIFATGSKNRTLGIENEKQLIGLGVSYCASCDGAFYRNKDVAVVGGGNTALEDALILCSYCKKVYVIHRRSSFRGEEKLLNTLKEKQNVEFILNSNVTELIADDVLNAVKVYNNITNTEQIININGIFIAIGQVPENKDFKDLINLDDYGYIIAGEDCKTNVEGIFVAGDCRTKQVRQLSTAAADGAVAAIAACEYIDSKYV